MTPQQKIGRFTSIEELLVYLEAAGIPTNILRNISKDLVSLKNNVLSREDYIEKIRVKISNDRDNILGDILE